MRNVTEREIASASVDKWRMPDKSSGRWFWLDCNSCGQHLKSLGWPGFWNKSAPLKLKLLNSTFPHGASWSCLLHSALSKCEAMHTNHTRVVMAWITVSSLFDPRGVLHCISYIGTAIWVCLAPTGMAFEPFEPEIGYRFQLFLVWKSEKGMDSTETGMDSKIQVIWIWEARFEKGYLKITYFCPP